MASAAPYLKRGGTKPPKKKTVALPVSPQTVMSSAATLFFLRRGHRSCPDLDARRQHSGFHVAPQCDQQLPRQGDDGDPARASCASCSAERRGRWPFDQLSLSPSGPRSLKRCTQSRSVWRSMPPIRAASARLIPSSTAASDSRRRLWLACLEAAASRRSSSVEKSALTVTAVAMARILPRHGISSTSRGKSPASQNGRTLVLPGNSGLPCYQGI